VDDAYVRDYPDYAYNYYDIYQDYEVWGMENDWLVLDVLFVAEKWFNKDIEHHGVWVKKITYHPFQINIRSSDHSAHQKRPLLVLDLIKSAVNTTSLGNIKCLHR